MTDKKPARYQTNRDANAPDDESVREGHEYSGNQSRNDGAKGEKKIKPEGKPVIG